MEINSFQPEDQPAVKALVLAGLKEHWGCLDPTRNPDLDDIAATYAKATFLVARQEGRVVGCGALVPRAETTAEIVRMSVAGELRRQGLGRQIVEALIAAARSGGFRRVVLETTATWSEVIAFYLRCGFYITHTQDGDVYFALDLDSPPAAAGGRDCPFCRAGIAAATVWESERYRIVPDEHPRCLGHLLLLTKAHVAGLVEVTAGQTAELETAQDVARRFLLDTFGQAAFLENGATHQETPHAHLHCVPFGASLPPGWVAEGLVRPVGGWDEVWQEQQRVGHYCYIEMGQGRFVLAGDEDAAAYHQALNWMGAQAVAQTDATLDPGSGMMRRGGPERAAATAQLFRQWGGK